MDVIDVQPQQQQHSLIIGVKKTSCCKNLCDFSSKKHLCHCYSGAFSVFPGINCICDACIGCFDGNRDAEYIASQNCCNSVEDPCCYDISLCFCPCVFICDILTMPLRFVCK